MMLTISLLHNFPGLVISKSALGVVPLTVNDFMVSAVQPSFELTCSCTLYVPTLLYLWVAFFKVEVLGLAVPGFPSPKFQRYVNWFPALSLIREESVKAAKGSFRQTRGRPKFTAGTW